MIPKIAIKKEKVLHIFYAVIFLFLYVNGWSQTRVFAVPTGSSSVNTDNASLAYDGLLTTKADVRAQGSGILVTPYDGHIELQFPTTLPANTTSYVKIATDDTLLSSLLGGTLGDLLASLVGVLLAGNQEFSVEAKLDNGTAVLSGSSTLPAQFGTERLRIVLNKNVPGEYFIRITPSQPYNRIRLTNKVGAALLAGNVKKLYVYDAFYIDGKQTCGTPEYTSYSGTGILTLGATNVTNPQRAIDSDQTNFSTLNIGLLGVGPSIEQTVYFEGASDPSDIYTVKIGMSAGLLGLDVFSNVRIIASNGGTVVQTRTLSELLTLNLLSVQGQIVTIYMYPGVPADRITVQFSSFLSLGVIAQSLNFYGVTKMLGLPLITQNPAICQNSTASLIATAPVAGAQLRWYSDAAGTTLLATRASGVAFETPVLSASQTYYVAQVLGTCIGFLRSVTVNVLTKPGPGSIAGEQTLCSGKPSGILTSVSADSGGGISYQWEMSVNETDWTEIPGANLPEYQPISLLKTTFFRRITTISSGSVLCRSNPSNSIKIIIKSCMVISNPMVRQRIKSGS